MARVWYDNEGFFGCGAWLSWHSGHAMFIHCLIDLLGVSCFIRKIALRVPDSILHWMVQHYSGISLMVNQIMALNLSRKWPGTLKLWSLLAACYLISHQTPLISWHLLFWKSHTTSIGTFSFGLCLLSCLSSNTSYFVLIGNLIALSVEALNSGHHWGKLGDRGGVVLFRGWFMVETAHLGPNRVF